MKSDSIIYLLHYHHFRQLFNCIGRGSVSQERFFLKLGKHIGRPAQVVKTSTLSSSPTTSLIVNRGSIANEKIEKAKDRITRCDDFLLYGPAAVALLIAILQGFNTAFSSKDSNSTTHTKGLNPNLAFAMDLVVIILPPVMAFIAGIIKTKRDHAIQYVNNEDHPEDEERASRCCGC